MSGLEYGERVKYSISIEMEVPSCESARYLPDSLVVRFDKKNETTKEVTQPSEQLLRIDKDRSKNETDHRLGLFMDVFRALADDNKYDVEKESLIDELILTGRFTEQDVVEHIKKAQQNGLIFERKVNTYACTP